MDIEPLPLTITIGYPARPLAYSRVQVSQRVPETVPADLPIAQPIDTDAQKLLIGLATVILEGLSGKRPFSQLNLWIDDNAIAALDSWKRTINWSATRLASIHPCSPRPGVVEASVRYQTPTISLAAAMRVEKRMRWVCTHFSVLLPHRR